MNLQVWGFYNRAPFQATLNYVVLYTMWFHNRAHFKEPRSETLKASLKGNPGFAAAKD